MNQLILHEKSNLTPHFSIFEVHMKIMTSKKL